MMLIVLRYVFLVLVCVFIGCVNDVMAVELASLIHTHLVCSGGFVTVSRCMYLCDHFVAVICMQLSFEMNCFTFVIRIGRRS